MIEQIAGAAIILALFVWLAISYGAATHAEAPINVAPRVPDLCPPGCDCRGTDEFGPEFWPTVYEHAMEQDRAQQIREGVPADLLWKPKEDR